MPNHVANRLTAPAEVLAAIIVGSDVDFNTMIPTPAIIAKHNSIDCRISGLAEIALGLIDWQSQAPNDIGALSRNLHLSNAVRQLKEGEMAKDLSDEDFEKFVDLMRAYRETGSTYWYEWNIANWGTKWNAYSSKIIGPNVVEFETAWSAPHPVIAKLALQFPLTTITHAWADEDTGRNCGRRIYTGDQFTTYEPEKFTKEGYEMAFELRPDRRDNYRFSESEGTYVYCEEEETEAAV